MTIGKKIPTKPKVYTKEELEIKKELEKYRNNYIFINTNFKRKGEPIFALAFCESVRRIKLDSSKFIFKTLDEILVIISDIIKEHYIESQGNIGIWGDVVSYIYNHIDGEAYIFDINGNQIESEPVFESKAILTIQGKQL